MVGGGVYLPSGFYLLRYALVGRCIFWRLCMSKGLVVAFTDFL